MDMEKLKLDPSKFNAAYAKEAARKALRANIHCSDPTGYLNIFHRDGEYHIELHVGVQCTELAYSNEDYESIKWFAEQFAIAIKRTGGDVRLYGQDSLDNAEARQNEAQPRD